MNSNSSKSFWSMLLRWLIACAPFVLITIFTIGSSRLYSFMLSIPAAGFAYLAAFYFIKSGRKMGVLLVPVAVILSTLVIQSILIILEITTDTSLYITISQILLILLALYKIKKNDSLGPHNTKRYFGKEDGLLLISVGAIMNGLIYLISDHIQNLQYISSLPEYYSFLWYSFFQSLDLVTVFGYLSCLVGAIAYILMPYGKMFFKWWFDLKPSPSSSASPTQS